MKHILGEFTSPSQVLKTGPELSLGYYVHTVYTSELFKQENMKLVLRLTS
jgi:hypothetical protein